MFFHREMIAALDQSKHEFVFCSSERRMDQSGLIDNFYNSTAGAVVDDNTLNSIILRCRFLSGINNKRAREYVRRMWRAVEDLFTQHKFELFLAPPVDNYVLDIICRIASREKILALQPRNTPLPGHARITNSCDHPVLRVVPRAQAEEVLGMLQKSFKAHYQDKSRKNNWKLVKRMLREMAKKPVFEYWKWRHDDPLSFHYNTIFPNQNAITFTSLKQLRANDYFDLTLENIKARKSNYKRMVFWPLSMSPESAINYLNCDCRLSDYKYLIERTVAALPDDWCLVVKEHPSAIGYRPLHQYEPFMVKDNILRLSMDVSTSQVIKLSDSVLLNTGGTTGLEAVALGRNVLSIGNCHYKFGSVVKEINNFDNIAEWPNTMSFDEVDHETQVDVIQNYLRNTVVNATWGPRLGSEQQYSERIRKTFKACIDLAQSGYCPTYFGFK